MDSGWFDRVYEDEDCTILRLRDQKGEPPPESQPDPDEEGGDEPTNSP